MVEDLNYGNKVNVEDEDEDIIFKVYIKEVEIFLNDFTMKPNYFFKTIRNHNDFIKLKSITKVKAISPIEIFYKVKYESFMKISQDDEKCSICLDHFYEFDKNWEFSKIKEMHNKLEDKYNVCLLDKCSDHFFHLDCLNSLIGSNNFVKCPVCSKIYGKQTGNQPPGKMTANIMTGTRCSGYNCDTICVIYNFQGGPGYSGKIFNYH